MRVSLATIGCKLNQAETQFMGQQLEEAGFQVVDFGDPVDWCVLNTCVVTAQAEGKSRRLIRRAIREFPGVKILVAGCYADLEAEKIARIPGVHFILGTAERNHLLDYMRRGDGVSPKIFIGGKNGPQGLWWDNPCHCRGRTRAFLKIQDGCNHFCSYCVVPYARGRSRSLPLGEAIAHAQKLVKNGYREIVLTGVNIGDYRSPEGKGGDLCDLLEALMKLEGLVRIRLSSLEPWQVGDRLIDLVASGGDKICRHFHLPLQSGDDGVLKRMKRGYRQSDFQELVGKIADRIPGVGIGLDVMVGFPGEDERAFSHTVRLIERLPIDYLHVFRYSERRLTEAAHFPFSSPKAKVIKERSATLRELDKDKRKAYRLRFVDQVLPVLFEGSWDDPTNLGLSDNYLRVLLDGDGARGNELYRVRIVGVRDPFLVGRLP